MVLAWFGVIGLLVNGIVSPLDDASVVGGLFRAVSSYTWQSNLLVALWLTFAVRQQNDETWILSPLVHGAVTVYITVTFIVFAAVLERLWNPVGLLLVLSIVTHYIVPIAFITDWVLFEARRTYRWGFIWRWLAFPMGYLVFALVRGAIVGSYIYPFLEVGEIGWRKLALNVVFLAGFFAILGSVFVAVNRRLPIAQQDGDQPNGFA